MYFRHFLSPLRRRRLNIKGYRRYNYDTESTLAQEYSTLYREGNSGLREEVSEPGLSDSRFPETVSGPGLTFL